MLSSYRGFNGQSTPWSLSMPEIPNSVDQKTVAFLTRYSTELSRAGSIQPRWRQYKGHRLGPYYLIVCRHLGRQVSLYLGADESLVNTIRDFLNSIQVRLR